eukprot:scaffold3777_cov335-Prasinococcus_capsulatus_cf.AAC.3
MCAHISHIALRRLALARVAFRGRPGPGSGPCHLPFEGTSATPTTAGHHHWQRRGAPRSLACSCAGAPSLRRGALLGGAARVENTTTRCMDITGARRGRRRARARVW